MRTHVEFRSTAFPPYEGEEEQINPGRYGRRLAGHQVAGEFLWLGGEAEPAMTRLCNEALAAAGSPFRFYEVPSGDQCCYVALVTPSAYEAVKARGRLQIRELSDNRWGAVIE